MRNNIRNKICVVNFYIIIKSNFTVIADTTGIFVAVNFCVQIAADFILSFVIDRLKWRPLICAACVLSIAGYVLYGLLPYIFPENKMFAGIILATVIFSLAGGALEVLLSPIIDNIPDGMGRAKPAAMALLHSFYAWGQVFCVVAASVFILTAGYANWNFVPIFMALVPLAALICFLKCPIEKREPPPKGAKEKRKVFKSGFFIVALVAIALGGGSEVMMNQYVSTFAELGLGFDKATADLAGMAMFAIALGAGRALYGAFGQKTNINKVLITGSALAVGGYLLAGLSGVPIISLVAGILCGLFTSLLWPGTLVSVSARFKTGGAWMFAALAVAGDVGAAAIPAAGGALAEVLGLNLAFVITAAIPALCCLCHIFLHKKSKDFNRLFASDKIINGAIESGGNAQ